jgi:DNA invertase Pin-like site-specific DNA recombinase
MRANSESKHKSKRVAESHEKKRRAGRENGGFGPRPSLLINHLHCEIRRTQGRIGQVGLVVKISGWSSL